MTAAFDAIAIGQRFDFGVYEFTAERHQGLCLPV